MTTPNVSHLETVIADMEERTGDLPDLLGNVTTWVGYIDAAGAEQLLSHNIRPEIGKVGTNRPMVTGSVASLLEAILGANWQFNHQGIAFDVDGRLIDGQHRLEAIVRADKVQPGIMVPIMVTWNLPREANEKIDLVRRRNTGTFLAMEGYAQSSRLNTILKLLHLYDTTDFDAPLNAAHWNEIPDLATIRKSLADHKIAPDSCTIGGQLGSILTPSAAGAGWVICRERYPDEMNMEFVAGLKSGANLAEGDPRLALREWARNRKEQHKRAQPYVHLAVYLKAFKLFRQGQPVKQGGFGFKPTAERFPRP